MKDANQISLNVVGDHTMHCAGCERSIEFTLAQFPEVQEVKADWKSQAIKIDLKEDHIDIARIKEELAWIGYEVETA